MIAAPALNKIKLPKRLHHDFETYSDADLRKVGSSRYAQHPSTEVLMCGYAFDNGDVQQWVPVEGQELPAQLEDGMLDERIKKFAWNKPFEWAIWKHVLGYEIPHRQWRDPMVLALSCSLPGKLDKAGPIVGLDDRYLKKSGTRLINWFSKKRPATKTLPERRVHWHQKYDLWQEYLEYNRFDVLAERKIYLNLSPYDLPEHEWDLWAIDQEINTRGIPINMQMVQNACTVRDEIIASRMERMHEITGLENPNSPAQLLPWLQDQGYIFEDLKAGHIRRSLQLLDEAVTGGDSHPEEIRDLWDVLELRAEVSKSSTKKFNALAAMTDDDGRLRNAHQFAGAGRTWRWGGRGFQPQNLAKPDKALEDLDWYKTEGGYMQVVGGVQINAAKAVATMDADTLELLYPKPMDVLSGAVRTVVQAPDGYVFIDADLNAIENVGLGWVAGDKKILGVFEKGKDPYIDFATYLYERPYNELFREYKEGDKGKRTIAKPGVLGCLKGDTPVLTQHGWKAIVELTVKDWLHDGDKWVRHSGVVFKGHQEVLCGGGLHATPDHKFLTEDGWREKCLLDTQQRTLESAKTMGDGVLWNTSDQPDRLEGGFFADANVVENVFYQDQTSSEDYPLVAPDALFGTVAPTSENELAQTSLTASQIVSTLRDRVAKTRKTVRTSITDSAVFLSSSTPLAIGSRTLWIDSVRTGLWKSTGSTTTEITQSATYDWRREQHKTLICDTWDILNSGDYARFAVLTEDGCLVAHNCGYMLSAGKQYEDRRTGEIEATGLLGYAKNMYVDLTPEQAELSVNVWRDTYKDAVQFWWDIKKAAMACVRTGKPTSVRSINFDRKGPFLRMLLPSGRALHYVRPRLEEWMMPWGKYALSLTYEQVENYTWGRVSTHPGKLTENAVQAIARDLLAHGIIKAEDLGIKIVMHVHDQIVALVKEDEAEEKLGLLMDCMGARPEWARSIPMKAGGHISKWFVKD